MDEPKPDNDLRATDRLIQQRIVTLRVMRETFEADLMEQPQEDSLVVTDDE